MITLKIPVCQNLLYTRHVNSSTYQKSRAVTLSTYPARLQLIQSRPSRNRLLSTRFVRSIKLACLFASTKIPWVYYPQVNQTSCNQHTAQTNRISKMTFMNMKTATFLIREKSLDLKTSPVIFAGKISMGNIAGQVNGFFMATTPPAD